MKLENAWTLKLSSHASESLYILGWAVSDQAIRSGLEETYFLGRSQFLRNEEAEAVGLSGVSVLLDGGLPLMHFSELIYLLLFSEH